MKSPRHDPPPRAHFSPTNRHYHRADVTQKATWDDWVHGSSGRQKGTRKRWLRWALLAAAVLMVIAFSAILVTSLT